MKKLFLACMLFGASTAFGQLTLVGGCAASGTSCSPATVGGHSFASGQYIYTFAYRTATTAPTLASGFTTLDTASANSSSFRSGCSISSSSSPSSGTWNNATYVTTLIYSGEAATTTATCVTAGVGGHTSSGTSGTGTTVTYTGVTMTKGDGSSWVVASGGDSTTPCTPASGLTAQFSATLIRGNDTNGPVSSFSSKTCTGSGNWKTDTVELLSAALTAPSFSPSTENAYTSVSVTPTLPSGATGCYTTDGTTPTATTVGTCSHGSTWTSGTVSVTPTASGTVLKMIATLSGATNSAETDATYTLPKWSTFNGITAGGSAGNISSINGITIGANTGNYSSWNRLLSPSGGGTLSLVQQVRGRAAEAANYNCVTTTCTLTVASTGSGTHAGVLVITDDGLTVSTVTGGCTSWTIESGTHQVTGQTGEIVMATCPSANWSSGSTGVVVTYTTTSAGEDPTATFYELSCSSCSSITVDAVNSASNSTSVSPQGPTLTIGGTDAIIQGIQSENSGSITTINSPWTTNFYNTDTSTACGGVPCSMGLAAGSYELNANSYSQPTYTASPTSITVVAVVGMKVN